MAVDVGAITAQAMETYMGILAVDATYTPPGGSGVAIRLLVARQTEETIQLGLSQTREDRRTGWVRRADVADPGPARNGTMTLTDGTVYTIRNDPVGSSADHFYKLDLSRSGG